MVDSTTKVSTLPLEKYVMLVVEKTTLKQYVLKKGERTNLIEKCDKCGHFGKRVDYVECDHENNSNDTGIEDLMDQF